MTTIDFDPFAYHAGIKAHPENYISLAKIKADLHSIRRIRHAATLVDLKTAFQIPAKLARADGDTELLRWLTEAKDARKKQLETP